MPDRSPLQIESLKCHSVSQAAKEFVFVAESEGKRWQKMFGRDQRLRLVEMVEEQHRSLEEDVQSAGEHGLAGKKGTHTLSKTDRK